MLARSAAAWSARAARTCALRGQNAAVVVRVLNNDRCARARVCARFAPCLALRSPLRGPPPASSLPRGALCYPLVFSQRRKLHALGRAVGSPTSRYAGWDGNLPHLQAAGQPGAGAVRSPIPASPPPSARSISGRSGESRRRLKGRAPPLRRLPPSLPLPRSLPAEKKSIRILERLLLRICTSSSNCIWR